MKNLKYIDLQEEKNIDCETWVGCHHWSVRKDATTALDWPKINANKSWGRNQFLRPCEHLVMKPFKISSTA